MEEELNDDTFSKPNFNHTSTEVGGVGPKTAVKAQVKHDSLVCIIIEQYLKTDD